MESEDAVALLELGDSCTDFMDGTSDIITLVDFALLGDLGVFPLCMSEDIHVFNCHQTYQSLGLLPE